MKIQINSNLVTEGLINNKHAASVVSPLQGLHYQQRLDISSV